MDEFKYDDFRGYEKKSYARLEFLALEEELTPLLDKGLSAKAIYRYFKDKERLTMCYQTFAAYVRRKYGSKQKNTAVNDKHSKETTVRKGVTEQAYKHDADSSTKVAELFGDDSIQPQEF